MYEEGIQAERPDSVNHPVDQEYFDQLKDR
jgi:hypothetical protein